MQISIRIWILALLFAGVQIGAQWIEKGYVVEIQSPPMHVRDLPYTLGDWHGEERAIDPEIVDHLNGRGPFEPVDFTDRAYRNPNGEQILAHIALWADSDWVATHTGTPHSPEFCYPGAGWTIRRTKDIRLELEDGRRFTVRVLDVERDGEKVKLLFWYQIGEHTYVTRDGWRAARRHFWGQRYSPPIIKVLLHTSADDAEHAEVRLRDFAKLEFERLQSFLNSDPNETPGNLESVRNHVRRPNHG